MSANLSAILFSITVLFILALRDCHLLKLQDKKFIWNNWNGLP